MSRFRTVEQTEEEDWKFYSATISFIQKESELADIGIDCRRCENLNERKSPFQKSGKNIFFGAAVHTKQND